MFKALAGGNGNNQGLDHHDDGMVDTDSSDEDNDDHDFALPPPTGAPVASSSSARSDSASIRTIRVDDKDKEVAEKAAMEKWMSQAMAASLDKRDTTSSRFAGESAMDCD
jgi:hypothetical protein